MYSKIFHKSRIKHKDLKWTCVWGNVDGAKAKIILEQKDNHNFDIVDECFREVETDGTKIFLVHFPLLGLLAAKSGNYRAVFYGDNHTKKIIGLSFLLFAYYFYNDEKLL